MTNKRNYYTPKLPLSTATKHKIARHLGDGEEFEFVAFKFNVPLIHVLEVHHQFKETIQANLALRKLHNDQT